MLGRQIATLAAATGLAVAVSAPVPAVAGSPTIVVAQAGDAPAIHPTVRRHRPPTHITVYPTERLQRDCRAWYEVQHRPSGNVIYPQMNCQWTVR